MDQHLAIEDLSALADGELDLSTSRNASEHLATCESCSAQLAEFGRLDVALAAPAILGCAAATELRSALLDGEISREETSIVVAHLASCEGCRTAQAAWSATETVLRAMPAAIPSIATDARVARLTAPAPRPRFPLAGPTSLRPFALRSAAAVAVVLAILVGLLPTGGPEQAQQLPEEQTAFVAGVQQVVLYSPTNTLYVLNTAAAAVDALDGSTYAPRARITVGGRPTALALNALASRVLVLDASQRSLTEIDTESNAVVATTQIPVTGKPTGLQVDQTTGRIIVASIPDLPLGGPAPTPTVGTKPGGGFVTVLDGTTKKLETVRTIDVAPSQIVSEPDGKRSLMISRTGTTVLDASLKTLSALPGGIAGAFGVHGLVAVLAAEPGNAVLHFAGNGAPAPLRIPGAPVALTPLPDGGFAVLLGSEGADGRIVVVDETGNAVGVTAIAQVGRDLTYDRATKRFAVVADGKVASAPLPAGIVAGPSASEEPRASLQPSASARPSVTPAPTSPTPSGIPSRSTSPAASPSPLAVAPSPVAAVVPAAAQPVGPEVYRIGTPDGRLPMMVAATSGRVWFLDEKNGLNALNTGTGEMYTLAQLPRTAQVRSLAADQLHVYAIDASEGRLYSFSVASERLKQETIPTLRRARSLAVADTGVLWVGLDPTGELLSIDPVTHRMEAVTTGVQRITVIAPSGGDGVWFSDGSLIGSYDIAKRKVALFTLRAQGAAHLLLPDHSGTLWIGTTAGEVFALRDGTASLFSKASRGIAALALDRTGAVWSLGPSTSSAARSAVIPLSGQGAGQLIDAPVFSLNFTATGRAWIADASGGFYLVVEQNK